MIRSAIAALLFHSISYSQNNIKDFGMQSSIIHQFKSSAIFENFAMAKKSSTHDLFISINNQFEIEELNSIHIGFGTNLKDKALGVGYSFQQENNLFRHNLNLGIQMEYASKWFFSPIIKIQSLHIENYPLKSQYEASVSFGIRHKPKPNWDIGLLASHVLLLEKGLMKLILSPFLSFTFQNHLIIALQGKISNQTSSSTFLLQMLYKSVNNYGVFFNYNLEANSVYIGFTHKKSKFQWNLLLGYHTNLGYSPSLEFQHFWP